jgi:hypothetical protein
VASEDQELPCFCLLDDENAPDESTWDQREKDVAGHIREHGWHVMMVYDDENVPGWTYSIGLWHTFRVPELCMFGVPQRVMADVINILGAQIRAGRPVRQDERRSGVIANYDLTFRPVHNSWYFAFFGTAIDFYQQPPLPMAQVFWPDPEGRFPWEADLPDWRETQPALWLDRDEHPDSVWKSLRA